jgi:predicted aconitase with swiveling domain
MERLMRARVIVAGAASGRALVSSEPLSFWGGYDYRTGEIIDRRHPLSGEWAAGRILAVPFTRGSSTTTAVLLEAVKAGTAPAALITTGVDAFFALASIVADVMHQQPIPIVALNQQDFATLKSGDQIEIRKEGLVVVRM